MSFIKFPKAVVDVLIPDTNLPVYVRVFMHLAAHSDFKTGAVHASLTAQSVADAVQCSYRSVSRAVSKLRELGWLVGGTGLAGTLAGFKTRPYRSSGAVRKSEVKAVLNEVTPHSPSSNGSRPRKSAHIPVREVRETQSFQEVLSRAKRNIPDS